MTFNDILAIIFLLGLGLMTFDFIMTITRERRTKWQDTPSLEKGEKTTDTLETSAPSEAPATGSESAITEAQDEPRPTL